MKHNDTAHLIRSFTLVLCTAVVVAVVFVIGMQYLQLKEQEVRYSAIDACGQIARVSFESRDETTGQLTKSELPATDSYKQCLKEKGIDVK